MMVGKEIFAVILLALFTFVCSISNGQSHKIDSLKALTSNKIGTELCDIYLDLSLEYIDVDFRESLDYASKSLFVAINEHDSLRISRAERFRGASYRRLEVFDSALISLGKALRIARRIGDKDGMKATLNSLAIVYLMEASYAKALSYFFEARDIANILNDRFYTGAILNNIGLVYYKMSNYKKAAEYYEECLKFKIVIREFSNLDRLFVNLSLCYAFLDDFKRARECLKVAYDQCDSTCVRCENNCDSRFQIEAGYCAGIISFRSCNHREAEEFFTASQNLSISTDNRRFQLENIVYLCQLYVADGRFSLAHKYLIKGEQMASGTEYNLLKIQLYKQFCNYYFNKDEFRAASLYQTKYIHLKDSIYNEDLTQHLMVIQAEAEQQENIFHIESQQKILSLKDDIINRQQYLTFLSVIALMLLSALIIVLLRINFIKRNANVLLGQKIRERTAGLQSNYLEIQRICKTKQNLTEKTAREINALLNTVKGLSDVALNSASKDKKKILFPWQSVSEKLSECINSLMIKLAIHDF
jgi:tetratricopeptide (TPR) repeat protein